MLTAILALTGLEALLLTTFLFASEAAAGFFGTKLGRGALSLTRSLRTAGTGGGAISGLEVAERLSAVVVVVTGRTGSRRMGGIGGLVVREISRCEEATFAGDALRDDDAAVGREGPVEDETDRPAAEGGREAGAAGLVGEAFAVVGAVGFDGPATDGADTARAAITFRLDAEGAVVPIAEGDGVGLKG